MSKVKRTPIPVPGSGSKSSKELSKEFISSSDDEFVGEHAADINAPKKKPAKSKTKVNIAVHRPKTNGVSKNAQVPLPSPASARKKVNNKEPRTGSSSLEKPQGAKENSGIDESDSASSSDSSSEDSDEGTAPGLLKEAAIEPTKLSQSHTVEFHAVQPFVPPKGFTAVSTPLNTSSQAVKMFENLEGKEIWHITAPAGVSVSQLKELAMDKALAGAAIVSQGGLDYGFSVDEKDEEGSRQLLIPGQNGYEAAPMRIKRTLHLQQVLRLPNLTSEQADQNTGSEAAASITRSTIRAPRPQVKGLRMRYFHSGFGDTEPGTLGSSDSEAETPAPAGLGIPNGSQVLNKPEKRKHEGVNGLEQSGSPTKKHKKLRTPEEIKKREEKKAKKERKKEKERTKS